MTGRAVTRRVVLLTALLACNARAELAPDSKVLLTRLGGLAIITAYGVAQFDYGERTPHTTQEHWFQADTKDGGADKLGHLYTTYTMSHAFGALYEHWGYPQEAAGRRGAITGILLMGFMELGDSFSPYGFSGEDMAMNLLGSYLGHYLYVNETWRQRVDLRWEYLPNSQARDPATDYTRSKYLVALKLDGFATLRDTPAGWLELQTGYFVHGYDSAQIKDTRTVYMGLGINLSRLLKHHGFNKTAHIFNYWQPWESTLRAEHRLQE